MKQTKNVAIILVFNKSRCYNITNDCNGVVKE